MFFLQIDFLMETPLEAAKLKDMVTTPAGVTIDGIMELEGENLTLLY